MRLSSIDGPWTVGPDEDGSEVCSVYAVNRGFRDIGPESNLEVVQLLRFSYLGFDNTGMPDTETNKGLRALEDRFDIALEAVDHSAVVGRYTSPEVGRTYCFYTSDTDVLVALLSPLIPPYAGQCNEANGGPDRSWSVYFDLLAHAEAGAPDIALVQKLTSMNVDLLQVRTVEHFLYFPTRDAALYAVNDCFSDLTTNGPFEADGNEWGVMVQLRHSLQFADIAHWRHVLVRDVCRGLDGTYDGWGVPLEGRNRPRFSRKHSK